MYDNMETALDYASKGWKVFPLTPKTKIPRRGSKGVDDATTDVMAIRRWWSENPAYNIGLATGYGFFVIDIDGEEGSRSLTGMESRLGALPETLEVQTPNNGRHLYFETKKEIRNKQSLFPGIDIRGMGGYVVAPPSVLENGRQYHWAFGENISIAPLTSNWIKEINPEKKLAPWEQIAPSPVPRKNFIEISGSPVIDRAKKYLLEIPPAVQGSGGHSSLMWAARAMVSGFNLDKETALDLLWNDFNPRCIPRWDPTNPVDKKDFERKVLQALKTPCDKPNGWLLEKYSLSAEQKESEIKIGKESRLHLLKMYSTASKEIEEGQLIIPPRVPFPTKSLPKTVAKFVKTVAKSHCVDESMVALPVLAAAGAAAGNAFRLKIKGGFVVPTTLWVGLIAGSGRNKTGPLKAVVAPLEETLKPTEVDDLIRNPQHPLLISDATVEATVSLLGSSPRGLLLFRDELPGWLKSFNSYKAGGGDEQTWIEFWNANKYQSNRKTNNEKIVIKSASVGVLGGIQPKLLKKIFDAEKFESGLAPRLLVSYPPPQKMKWTDDEINAEDTEEWRQIVNWIRSRPFIHYDLEKGYEENMIGLTPEAKEIYVEYFMAVSDEIEEGNMCETAQSFASKARLFAARFALIHHLLTLAEKGGEIKDKFPDVTVKSMQAGVDFAEWALNEQLRVYGLASRMLYVDHKNPKAESRRGKTLLEIIESLGGKAKIRAIMQSNCAKYPTALVAREACQELIDDKKGYWTDEKQREIRLYDEE